MHKWPHWLQTKTTAAARQAIIKHQIPRLVRSEMKKKKKRKKKKRGWSHTYTYAIQKGQVFEENMNKFSSQNAPFLDKKFICIETLSLHNKEKTILDHLIYPAYPSHAHI